MPGRDRGEMNTTTTIVFFLGGVTYAEIAALRWMTKQSRGEPLLIPFPPLNEVRSDMEWTGRRYVIATTGVISGRSLIESLGSATSGSGGLGPSSSGSGGGGANGGSVEGGMGA